MIDTNQKLAEFLPQARAASWLAVDTEADSLHAYPEKVCLVQISLPDADVLVDPLADLELAPLWEAFAGRELIFHGADYDLRMLQRGFGFRPHAVFDTMLAARLLGVQEFGLTNLTHQWLGVKLEKGPQKADWARRPLTERMIDYARNDTRYLKPLSDLLRARLVELGRLSWHQQMCAQLVHECNVVHPEDPDLVWRLKGVDRLDRRAMAVARELWHWREREAVIANLPPFFVLRHDTLVAMGDIAARGEAIERLVPTRYSPRRRAELLKAVAHALALPDAELPHRRRNHGHRLTQPEKERVERLKRQRDQQALKLELDPTLIASKAMLIALAHDWDKHAAELLPFQKELLNRGV